MNRARSVHLVGLAVLYFVAVKLSLSFAQAHGNVSSIWPPTGIAIAALLWFGPGLWPAITIGAFLATLSTGSSSVGVAAAIGVGNTLEAALAVFLLRRIGFRNSLDRVRDAVALIALAAIASPTVSASIGIVSLCLGGFAGWGDAPRLWFVWWAGDAFGALLVTPALLTWYDSWRSTPRSRRLEAVAAAATLALAITLVFRFDPGSSVARYPLEYSVLPVLFWIALRFHQGGAMAATLAVWAGAVWGTIDGLGPFASDSWDQSILMLQGFTGVISITVMVVTAAISERRAAEGEIRASEERFRTIFENAPVMIESFDEDGRCVLWNRECENTLGWTHREVANCKDPSQLFYPDPIERDAVVRHTRAADEKFREYRVRAKDGTTRVQQWALFGLPDGALIALGYDVTERKRVEEEVRRLNEDLEGLVSERTAQLRAAIARRDEAEELARQHSAELAHVLRVHTMGEMAAGLAHEINQPLAAIANYASGSRHRVASGSLGQSDLLRVLGTISSEALRAGDIVHHLRHLVRKQESKRALAPVNNIVRDAVGLMQAAARAEGVEIRLELADALPDVPVAYIQIEQVVLNLIRNGMDAMRTSANDRSLFVGTAATQSGGVEVAVRDTGIGVPAEMQKEVFEPFVTDKPEGLGMGLAISRSIILLHGGRLWFEPNGEQGSCFKFTLPPGDATASDSGNPHPAVRVVS